MSKEQEAELRRAVKQVLNYSWDDELDHFANAIQGDDPKHIFNALVVLMNWLEGQNLSPGDYVFHNAMED